MSEVEFIIEFSDITMIEADGEYDIVCEIMNRENGNNDWMIKSDVFITDGIINSQITLHLYKNKDIYIENYDIKKDEAYYSPDLECLSQWAQQNGWNTPCPNKDLLLMDIDFWKYFWETSLIDCDYFDNIYGKREF